MKILGRHCSTLELLMFFCAYVVGNIFIFKMQQQWTEQEAEEIRARQIHKQSLLSRSPDRRAGHGGSPGAAEETLHKDSAHGSLIPDRIPLEQSLYDGRDGHFSDEDDEEDDFRDGEGLKRVEGYAKLLTKEPPVTQGVLNSYPRDDELNEEAERLEREELKRQRLGDPTREGYKTILFWNKFFNSDDFRFGIGHQPFIEHKCPIHQCITTTDKRKLDSADLVMFHGPRIEKFPPPRRPAEQIYAYVQQEPHYAMSQEEIPRYNGYMNLTITNRRDGDIWIPYAKVGYDIDKPIGKPIKVTPKDRPRSVAWVVSHCSTPGKREWYVQELQKYIDIDIYGDCGDMECSKDDTWYCYEKFAREYRFYMALENNYCKDYISEKAFRPLGYNIVPIVFGGANYSELTPPHSVINIMDFPHPRDLARHLHYLNENEKAYNRYFAWKTRGYELDLSRKAIMGEAFCKVCEILHDPKFKYKEYRNLKSWWTNSMCDPYTIPRMRRKQKW